MYAPTHPIQTKTNWKKSVISIAMYSKGPLTFENAVQLSKIRNDFVVFPFNSIYIPLASA